MTLAAILAAHTAQSATPPSKGVAPRGARSVGAQGVTPVTPATSVISKGDVHHPLSLHAIRALLQSEASTLGIPRSVVDSLPTEELTATAEQVALCEGHLDGHGNPLPHALLVFYLRELAARTQA